jgi:hypothetical protein
MGAPFGFKIHNLFFNLSFLGIYMDRNIKGVYRIETTLAPPIKRKSHLNTPVHIDMNQSIEEWRSVAGFEDSYSVSNLGQVRSERRQVKCGNATYTVSEKILKPFLRSGYYSVVLMKDSRRHNWVIHRLVAKTFLEKVSGKSYVNHIDTCKTNNHVSNLEYVTQLENVRHAHAFGRCNSKSVMQIGRNGQIVNIWRSAMEAHRHGFNNNCIARVARFQQRQYRGYLWRYVDVKIGYSTEGMAA